MPGRIINNEFTTLYTTAVGLWGYRPGAFQRLPPSDGKTVIYQQQQQQDNFGEFGRDARRKDWRHLMGGVDHAERRGHIQKVRKKKKKKKINR